MLHRKFKIVTFLSISFPTSNITVDHTHLCIFYKEKSGEDDPVPLFPYSFGSLPCFCQPSRTTIFKEILFKSLLRDLFEFLLFNSELLQTRKQLRGPACWIRPRSQAGNTVGAGCAWAALLLLLEHPGFDQKSILWKTKLPSPPAFRSEKLLELSVQLSDFLCFCTFSKEHWGSLAISQ